MTEGCGFSGRGFEFVSMAVEILADPALTVSTEHPIGLFGPARFPAASG